MTTPDTPIPVRAGILRFAASALQLIVDDVDVPDIISRASNARAMIVEACPPDMFDDSAELIELAANGDDAPVNTVRYIVKGGDEFDSLDSLDSRVPDPFAVIILPDGTRARRSGAPDVHWVADRRIEVHVIVDHEGAR